GSHPACAAASAACCTSSTSPQRDCTRSTGGHSSAFSTGYSMPGPPSSSPTPGWRLGWACRLLEPRPEQEGGDGGDARQDGQHADNFVPSDVACRRAR